MRKLVLTGATGFIGNRLLHSSMLENWDVFAVVRGSKKSLPKGITPVVADMTEPGWTNTLPDNVDTVIHLAQSRCYKDFPGGAKDMKSINVDATFDLLEWARTSSVANFLLASTGNVCEPVGGRSSSCASYSQKTMYAATKFCAEQLALQYRSLFRVAIFRLFTTYGPGQRATLIPNIMTRVLDGVPVELAGAKGLILSPLHVDDVCDGVAALADSDFSGVSHWAGPEEMDLRGIAEYIGEALEKAPLFIDTEGDPLRLSCGPEDLQAILGRKPRFFNEGMMDTASEFVPSWRRGEI